MHYNRPQKWLFFPAAAPAAGAAGAAAGKHAVGAFAGA